MSSSDRRIRCAQLEFEEVISGVGRKTKDLEANLHDFASTIAAPPVRRGSPFALKTSLRSPDDFCSAQSRRIDPFETAIGAVKMASTRRSLARTTFSSTSLLRRSYSTAISSTVRRRQVLTDEERTASAHPPAHSVACVLAKVLVGGAKGGRR